MTVIRISILCEGIQAVSIIRAVILGILLETAWIGRIFYIELRSPNVPVIIVPATASFPVYKSIIPVPAHPIIFLSVGYPQKARLELRGGIIGYLSTVGPALSFFCRDHDCP